MAYPVSKQYQKEWNYSYIFVCYSKMPLFLAAILFQFFMCVSIVRWIYMDIYIIQKVFYFTIHIIEVTVHILCTCNCSNSKELCYLVGGE